MIAKDRRGGGAVRVLVIDCCGETATVALGEDGRVVVERALPGRRSSEALLPALRSAMEEAGWGTGGVDAVGVVRGPGSFTGVRVGVSAAKGLSEGWGVPLVAVTRFEVLARAAGRAEGCVAVQLAGRGEWFWGRVRGGAVVEQELLTAEALRERGEVVVCQEGEAAELGEGIAVERVRAIGAGDAVSLVAERLRAGEVADAVLLDAVYVRRTEQELLERQRAHRAAKEG